MFDFGLGQRKVKGITSFISTIETKSSPNWMLNERQRTKSLPAAIKGLIEGRFFHKSC